MSARCRMLAAAAAALALMLAAGPRAQQAAPASEATLSRVQVALLDWRGLAPDDRPRAVPGLMAAVQRRTAVEPDLIVPHLVPTSPAIFEHPLLVLAGSSALQPLTDREVDALRSHLTSGGLLLVDDRSGVADSPFARTARAELSRVLGGRPFEPLPRDHALYRAYYLLDRAWGRLGVSEDIEAIRIGGRAAIIFSANDLLGACERDVTGEWARPVEPGGAQQREMAQRLGVNVVLYALTLDYKEDLVHLPLILERKR